MSPLSLSIYLSICHLSVSLSVYLSISRICLHVYFLCTCACTVIFILYVLYIPDVLAIFCVL